jgi:hypothetical protein
MMVTQTNSPQEANEMLTKTRTIIIALAASASFAAAGPLTPVASATKNVGTYQKTVGKLKQIKAESPCPGWQSNYENTVEILENDAKAGDQVNFEKTLKMAQEIVQNAKNAGCSVG